MIANEHPVLGHTLEGLLIQVAKKRDGILLNTSCRRHPKESRVEVAHVRDGRLPIVERASMINDFQGAL